MHIKTHRAGPQPIARVEFAFPDWLIVDESPVRAPQVAHERGSGFNPDRTVAMADEQTLRAQVTRGTTADEKRRQGDRDRLPRSLPINHHDETQLHRMGTLPSETAMQSALLLCLGCSPSLRTKPAERNRKTAFVEGLSRLMRAPLFSPLAKGSRRGIALPSQQGADV